MTAAAEARLLAKLRAGETVTREDHVATIDDLAELDAFKAGVTEAGRMTETLLTAIYRRQVQIAQAQVQRDDEIADGVDQGAVEVDDRGLQADEGRVVRPGDCAHAASR